jgi:hypothetical protein
MVAPAKVFGQEWRRLGLVVEVETDFFSHPVADNMDRVWVRWFHPELGFVPEQEMWPSVALTRPGSPSDAPHEATEAERRTEP